MTDKKAKLTGPKFREYFMLHMKKVKWWLVWGVAFGIFVGWLWGDFKDYRHIVLYVLLIAAPVWRTISHICSGMLYQQNAYLYQSFPVSSFDTALTKTSAAALLFAVNSVTAVIVMYGLKGVQMVPAILSGSMLISGIILASLGFGNSLRDSRAKKPSAVGSFLAAALMLAAQVGLTAALVKWAPLSFGLKTLILTVVFTAEAAGLLWYNTRSLGNGYQL